MKAVQHLLVTCATTASTEGVLFWLHAQARHPATDAASAAAGGRPPSAEAKDMQEQMQQKLEDAWVVYETHKDHKRFCRE